MADDPEMVAFLEDLPPGKRQPNLLLATVRYLAGLQPDYAAFREVVLGRRDEVAATMRARRTQTNEPARCATLLPALAAIDGPLALLEVGASAGLCLLPDRYGYHYRRADGEDVHIAGSPLLTCEVRGPAPLPRRVPEVVWRAGLDLEPLDVGDPDDLRWLACLLWPGEAGRAERLDEAAAVARADPPRVVRGDLVDDLNALAGQAPPAATSATDIGLSPGPTVTGRGYSGWTPRVGDVPLVLGIDIGTSSSKGVLVDGDGTVVARADVEHATSFPHPGWVEHDAEDVWWADVAALTRELLAHGTPDAVGVSGIGPVLLPADAQGRPLRPAILYGVDTRATREISELTDELGAERIVARGGTPLSSQAVGPKWRWLQRHEPDVYARTERFLMASSYLVHRLTDEYVLDHHSASQCDPMYDLEAGGWAHDWCELVAPGLVLPRLLWPGDVAGTLHGRAARETGLPEGIPVIAGTIDAWAEAASVGVGAVGDTMVMYGTTMFLVQVTDAPARHPALWATRGVPPGSFTTAAGMATSGAITAWLRDLVGADYETLTTEATAVPPGARGLLLLPYFAGERTPIFDPDARGLVLGLTTGHGRGELYRAALEGTAHGVRHNLEAFRDAGGASPRLVAVGGGTRGGLWTQIVSDVTGEEQQVPADTTGAALGDALLAARALGLDADAATWNPIVDVVRPAPERTARYDAFHTHYRALYPATADAAHFLAQEQRDAGE